jgi:hypothetical protein
MALDTHPSETSRSLAKINDRKIEAFMTRPIKRSRNLVDITGNGALLNESENNPKNIHTQLKRFLDQKSIYETNVRNEIRI